MKRYIAEVIDNDDGEQKGRVQIYIPHIMEGWESDHYPWAFQDRDFTSFIPEIGDKVWVWFEEPEYFRKPFYAHKVNFHNSNDANETIGSLEGSYPDIKYMWFENGVAIAMNSNEPEISITNGSAEIFINQDGEINLTNSQNITIDNGTASLTMESNGDINITNGSATITLASTGAITLNTGDASGWLPCIIGNCLFTGAPHGGTVAGIINLSGA